MDPQEIAKLLEQTPLLAGVPPEELAALAGRTLERTFRAGEVVFHEGDPGDTLFVVAEGAVKVFVTSERADEMVLAVLSRPQAFGELAVVDGGPRSASVQAVEPTVLLALVRSALLDVLHSRPGLAEVLLRSLGSLVRRMIEQAGDLVFLDLHGRLAKLIVGMAERQGMAEGEELALELPVTQRDLAGMVGGSRQTVNAILHSFQDRGFLEVRGRTLVIRDLEALRRRAGV